jgi:hypothetical protein
MSKTYEAIYEEGHLEWLGDQPGAGRHHLLVTVIQNHTTRHAPQDVHDVLEATRGAWSRGRTLEEIDAEIDQMRAEWDRDDDRR